MKNIGNDPRSLFNGNHFSSILSRTELARLVMGTIVLVIGERSEPLSRVFNDQPRDIYI